MKIAQINKIIQYKGGVETVMANIGKGFRDRGDQVLNLGFSVQGTEIPDSVSLGPDRKKIARFFRDASLVQDVVRRLDAFQPDVVLTHNVYHSFPHAQLAQALKARGGILVGVLHDYKCVCPSYGLHISGNVCESCVGKHFYKAVIRKCHKNSRVVSAILAADSYWNVRLNDAYAHYDILISPSQFLRDKCLELGFKHPIQVLCNPIDFEVEPNVNFEQRQDAVLFAASLDDSKGVHTVIELAKRNPDIIFYFAGKGPLEKMIISESIKYSNIKYLGYLCRDDIKKSMRNVKCFIIASIWHEVLGMVVLEAFSQNCAVIGAKSGGITELLEGGRGILFRPNDPLSANEALQKCFLLNKNEYIKMAEKANAALNGASLAGYCKRIENLFLHWKLTTRQKNG